MEAQGSLPGWFIFNGKIRYHCVITDGCDSVCIASVPQFASKELCKQLIHLCEQSGFNHEDNNSKYSQATVDLEVDSAPTVRSFLLDRFFVPAVSQCIQATHELPIVSFDDVFVVKYDSSGEGPGCQRALELHFDGGDVTFMLALSSPEDYTGGGTYFDVLRHGREFANEDLICGETIHLQQGELLLFDAALKHAGQVILSGKRYLLIGFCLTNSTDDAGQVNLALERIG